MCLMAAAIFDAIQARICDGIFDLPGEVIQELWIVVFLAPTISTDLKAQVHPQLFLVILTRLPEEIVSELIRHKLTEAAWSKLLSPF